MTVAQELALWGLLVFNLAVVGTVFGLVVRDALRELMRK